MNLATFNYYSNKYLTMEICGFIGPQEIVVILVIVLVSLIIPIIALVDVLKSNFEGNNKIIWVLVILLLSIIGAILYFVIGKQQKIKDPKSKD